MEIPDQIKQNETGSLASKPQTRLTPYSLMLPVLIAAVLWGASFLLSGEQPFVRADSLANWTAFGLRIVRDTLRAAAVLAIAAAISAAFPGIGLWIERIVLLSPRWAFLAVTAALATFTSGLASYFVFDHFPVIQDEIAMIFQAHILASGRLFAETPALPEFFDWEFIVMDGPRWYGKYFLGSSLAFVPGIWIGHPWVINPILAGVAVCLTHAIGRNLINDTVGRLAAIVMVISPFRVSLFGIMMGHPIAMVALGLFTLGLIKVVKNPNRFAWSMAAGAGLGFAVNCRPLTAGAVGAVVGILALIAMPWRRFRRQTALAFLIPIVAFAAIFLGYNKALTGDALLTPFAKFSPKDTIGFGPDVGLEYWPPDDRGHTLRKALFSNSFYNLEEVAVHLPGWGNVGLVLLIWPVFFSRWPKRVRAVAAVIFGLAFAYLFYLTHSVVAGQARYWSESMPMMAILVAVSIVGLRRHMPAICRWLDMPVPSRTGRAAVWLTMTALIIWSGPYVHKKLFSDYSYDLGGPGWPLAIRNLHLTGQIENAIVFVQANHYRNYWRDRIGDTFGYGFSLNTPDLDGRVIYARDLGERNAELIDQYPNRTPYRFVHGPTRDLDDYEPISIPARSNASTP